MIGTVWIPESCVLTISEIPQSERQQGSCGSFIATFCSAEGSPNFASHESRHQCYNTGSTYKCTSRYQLCVSFLSLPFMFLLSSIGVVATLPMGSIATLYYPGDLSVERTASGTGTYNYADCFNAMTEMDTTCNGRGGIKTLNGFQFTLDPNLGSC